MKLGVILYIHKVMSSLPELTIYHSTKLKDRSNEIEHENINIDSIGYKGNKEEYNSVVHQFNPPVIP
jgi:hypothetical protein